MDYNLVLYAPTGMWRRVVCIYLPTLRMKLMPACYRPTITSSLSTHPSLPPLFSQNRSASAEWLFVKCYILEEEIIDLLKPTGYLMYQHF